MSSHIKLSEISTPFDMQNQCLIFVYICGMHMVFLLTLLFTPGLLVAWLYDMLPRSHCKEPQDQSFCTRTVHTYHEKADQTWATGNELHLHLGPSMEQHQKRHQSGILFIQTWPATSTGSTWKFFWREVMHNILYSYNAFIQKKE